MSFGIKSSGTHLLALSIVFSALLVHCTGSEQQTGSSSTKLGEPCKSNADCGEFQGAQLFCVTKRDDLVWADGYCTLACDLSNPKCPVGSVCAKGRTTYEYLCLTSCAEKTKPCRKGYLCDDTVKGYLCVPDYSSKLIQLDGG